jgi:predicted secreted protein
MDMVEMHVGEERDIDLLGLATAGYVWSYEVSGDAAVVTVTLASAGPVAPPADAPQLPQTGSYPEKAVLHAVARGRATVHLTLVRPWEKPAKPAQTRDIDVVVHD